MRSHMFKPADVRRRIISVDPIDEYKAGISRKPCGLNNLIENIPSLNARRHRAGSGIYKIIRDIALNRFHKSIANSDRDIEISQFSVLSLEPDKLQDIGVVHMQDAHVCAPSSASLLYDIRRSVVN